MMMMMMMIVITISKFVMRMKSNMLKSEAQAVTRWLDAVC